MSSNCFCFVARRRQTDLELGMNGYPSASTFIASDPDHTASIFHTFKRLTARNLLYMEAELFELQEQLDKSDRQDAVDGDRDPNILEYVRSGREMQRSANAAERNALIVKIRSAVKQYRTQYRGTNMRRLIRL